MSWDVFISYASEDEPLAEKLARALHAEHLRVSVGSTELETGGEWLDEIATGLPHSGSVVVVLSQELASAYLESPKLSALVKRELKGGRRILPIFHNVRQSDARRLSQMFADKLALRSDIGIKELASQIRNTIMQETPGDVGDPPDRMLSVLIDPGDAPEELLTEFYTALSAYYRACGGSGLSIKKDERRSLVGEAV